MISTLRFCIPIFEWTLTCNTFSFCISDNVSDVDSEKGVHDESILSYFNSTQESETSVIPTKTAEVETGKFCMTL